MRYWVLLLFLTLGMHGIYRAEEAKVVDVSHGLVTMETRDRVYQIYEDEAWRAGDLAEVITGRSGIVGARWKK